MRTYSPGGYLLRQARQAAGMTLQQIAQATGIATGRLSEYENGKHNITLDTFLRILAATDNTIQLVDACDGQFANPHVNARVFAELSSLADSA